MAFLLLFHPDSVKEHIIDTSLTRRKSVAVNVVELNYLDYFIGVGNVLAVDENILHFKRVDVSADVRVEYLGIGAVSHSSPRHRADCHEEISR